MKQDRTGYILTLSIHPDEVPAEILRDFVGARYAVVMVRINGQEEPMNREQENPKDLVRLAGVLCRDKAFQKFLVSTGQIIEETEEETVDWLRYELGITSRVELKTNTEAAKQFNFIHQEFQAWKATV
jgi:hypothetical protein